MQTRDFNRYDFIVLSTISAVILLQALILNYSPLNLSGDEAYYWLWSKNLDYCYYEKGPGIALLITLGCKIFGDTVLGVRAGALLSQFLISIILYLFIKQNYSRKIGVTSIALYWSTLIFGTLGLFMTCDPPLCLFWLLSLISARYAVEDDKPKYWLWAFLFIGLASLFKFTSLILAPSFALFLILTPRYRKHLVTPSFICGALLLLALLSPVIVWNDNHNWINFTKAYNHIGTNNRSFGIIHFFELISGQWSLIGITLFPIFCYVSYKSYKVWFAGNTVTGLLLCSSLPLIFLCIILSFERSVYANWPMPAYLGIILLFAEYQFRNNTLKKNLLKNALKINFFVIILAHFLFIGKTFGIPMRILPTMKLATGKELGKAINEKNIPASFASCEEKNQESFIIADRYMDASLMAFYSSNYALVYLSSIDEPKLSQFDIWQNWPNQKGKNVLLAFADTREIKYFSKYFSKITPLGVIERKYDDSVIGKTYFYVACNFNGEDLSTFATSRM